VQAVLQGEELGRQRVRRDRLPLARAFEIPPNETAVSAADLADALFYCRAEHAMLRSSSSHFAPPARLADQGQNTSVDASWPSQGFFCPHGRWTPLPPGPDADSTPVVRMWYCLSTFESTAGAFRVWKQSNCQAANQSFAQGAWTADETWRALVQETFGSEEFALNLEGPEVLGLIPAHLGDCRFEARFKVAIPGEYRVSLKWVREDYAAVRDNVAAWAPGSIRHPLGQRNVSIVLGDVALGPRVHAQVMAGEMPSCLGRSDISGRWVFKSGPQARFEEHVVPGRLGQLAFVRIDDYEWVPWGCQLPSLHDLVHQHGCLGRQAVSLAIAGDSHGKRMFQAVGAYVCRDAAAFANFTVKEKHSYVYDLDWCGSGKGYMALSAVVKGRLVARGLANLTRHALVFNFGSHSMQQPAPFAKNYGPGLSQVLAALAQLPHDVRATWPIWYDMPVAPFAANGYVVWYKDGRTLPRVHLWNRLAAREMRALDVRTVELEAMTLPWFVRLTRPRPH
jgi:hypothetical protein